MIVTYVYIYIYIYIRLGRWGGGEAPWNMCAILVITISCTTQTKLNHSYT